jgi:hypothetical protein
VTHRLVKIPIDSLDTWDAEHDAQGDKLRRGEGSSDDEIVDVKHGDRGEEKF